MNILGIDFGKKRIGLAISEGLIARPLSTITYKAEREALEKLVRIIQEQAVEKVIVGLPEPDTIGAKIFGEKLAELSGVSVEFVNETLTSEVAKEKMIKAGTSQKKRRLELDSIAAAIILQSYLENQ